MNNVSYGKDYHNDTVDVLLERVSIRAFKDEAIGLDVLNTIEQAAQNTASSQYLNDWSAIRIKDPAVKTEIARICNQDYIANAPVLYIFVLDQYRNSLIAQSEGVAVDSDEFTLRTATVSRRHRTTPCSHCMPWRRRRNRSSSAL